MQIARKKKSVQERQSSRDAKGVVVYFLFLAALGVTIYAMRLNDITVIEKRVLITISSIGTFICLLTLKLFKAEKNSFFWTLLVSIGIGGGLAYSTTLIINYAFAAKETYRHDFDILDTGETAKGRYRKCYPPYATIDFQGLSKRILFDCDDKDKIRRSMKVVLEYSNGLFGYAIIKSKTLVF